MPPPKRAKWVDPKLASPPPVTWRRHIVGDKDRAAAWAATTNIQRHNAWKCWREGQARLASLKALADAGVSRVRTHNIVANGGLRRHGTPELAKIAHKESIRASGARRSASTLDFRLREARGCSVDGCPLAETDVPVLLPLLEHDHVQRVDKVASVTHLTGPARTDELAKTQVLCAWHHFVKTTAEQNQVPFNQRPSYKREMQIFKSTVGCQHPLHASMQYAVLVPTAPVGNTSIGFFHVSHVKRGRIQSKIAEVRHADNKVDIQEGAAVIHCRMCHLLYTLCESAKLNGTPFTQQQFALLLRQVPAFVQHFEVQTADFDWEAERVRIGQRMSDAHAGRKRKAVADDVLEQNA